MQLSIRRTGKVKPGEKNRKWRGPGDLDESLRA